MSEYSITFTTTTEAKLDTLTVTDGQVICLSDKDGFYYDMNSSRHSVSGVEVLSSLSGTGQTDKIYIYNSQLYIWDGTQFVNTASAGGVTSFNSRTGAVTLSSIDVTAALGYIPPQQDTTYSTGVGLTSSGTTFKANLQDETASALTAAARGSEVSREYPVGVDSVGNLSVNVPWSNTTYTASGNGISLSSNQFSLTLNSTTKSSLATAAMGSTASRQYAVGLDSAGKLSVNIPWTDTTYSGSTTVTLSGTTFSLTKANVTTALGYTPPTSDTNTVPAAYCDTAAATAAKTATCTGYYLLSKSFIHVIVTVTNTAAEALTLNINGKGAKPIYINGAVTSSSNYGLTRGSYLVYYDGTNYYFRKDGYVTAVGLVDTSGNVRSPKALVGATSSANGSAGYINATPPKASYNTSFFRADGSWSVPVATGVTRTASTYVPGTTVEAALQNLGAVNTFSVATSAWTTTSDYSYSYKATISTTAYTANSVPVWAMIGTGTVTTKTEQAQCAKVEQAYFTASNITLYATAKPSVALKLCVRGC